MHIGIQSRGFTRAPAQRTHAELRLRLAHGTARPGQQSAAHDGR
jgi:hypothetical protein